jgi:hypothetical protein
MDNLQKRHYIAIAREQCAIAGIPLRNRWGRAASDEHILKIVEAVLQYLDDYSVAEKIGILNALGEIQICSGYDTPIDEEEELIIVQAIRRGLNDT